MVSASFLFSAASLTFTFISICAWFSFSPASYVEPTPFPPCRTSQNFPGLLAVLVLVIVVVSVLWQNDKQTNYVFVCLAWAQKKKKKWGKTQEIRRGKIQSTWHKVAQQAAFGVFENSQRDEHAPGNISIDGWPEGNSPRFKHKIVHCPHVSFQWGFVLIFHRGSSISMELEFD